MTNNVNENTNVMNNEDVKDMENTKEMAVVDKAPTDLQANTEAPLGFEDDDQDDIIIPRIKIVQALSPERKDKIADEGDIINSLTKDKLNGKVFVPVFKFNSNILWKDRTEGGGICCQARDGKVGTFNEGHTRLCKMCGKCEFDNTKQGREAIPSCTKYINFFGFIAGEPVPIILSFAKTNYKEGKKLYSLAKITMQNMWNHGYVLQSKLNSKNHNEWYTIEVSPAGKTSESDRACGANLYKCFKSSSYQVDMHEETSSENDPTYASESVDNVEF